ncbi:hypothetical protein ACED66_09590 [Vibrio splendidus]|nr:hypothetical protein [Vibrio splendidus]
MLVNSQVPLLGTLIPSLLVMQHVITAPRPSMDIRKMRLTISVFESMTV